MADKGKKTSQTATSSSSKAPQVVGGRYKLTLKVGSGSFGDIYKGIVPGTNEEYAIKLEPANARMPQLMYECKLYKHLNGGPGIPGVKWFGTEGGYNVMVMDLLGPSLEDLMSDKKRAHFSLKTTIMVADQMICRLEYLHSKDYVHRDIKPDNFLMGRDKKKNIVYIIDFGLAKRYRDATTHQHIPYREDKGLTGTVRYASINSHQGVEQSRRDDLESVGYVLIYFLTGSLPWQGLKIENRNQKFRAICDMKMSIPVEQLCKDCPQEFTLYMKYVKNLHFDAKPDYFYLRRLFRSLFLRSGFTLDFVYDWSATEGQSSNTSSSSQITPAAHANPPTAQQQTEQSQNTVKAMHQTTSPDNQSPNDQTDNNNNTDQRITQTNPITNQGIGSNPSNIFGNKSPLLNTSSGNVAGGGSGGGGSGSGGVGVISTQSSNLMGGGTNPGQALITISTVPGAKLTTQQQQNITTLQQNMQHQHTQGQQIQNELFILQQQQFHLQQQVRSPQINLQIQQNQQQQQQKSGQLQQINNTLQNLTQKLQLVGGSNIVITVNNPIPSPSLDPRSIPQQLQQIQQQLSNLQLLSSNNNNILSADQQAYQQSLLQQQQQLQQMSAFYDQQQSGGGGGGGAGVRTQMSSSDLSNRGNLFSSDSVGGGGGTRGGDGGNTGNGMNTSASGVGSKLGGMNIKGKK